MGRLQLEGLMADRADEPVEILLGEGSGRSGLRGHGLILAER